VKIQEAIEMLRCAEINCDNAKRVPVLLNAVKMQIQEALKLLEENEEEKA